MMLATALYMAGSLALLAGEGQDTKKVDAKKLKEIQAFERELDEDRRIGKEAAEYYDKEYKPTKDPASQKRVEELGAKLALIANSQAGFKTLWGEKRQIMLEYRFKVVDSKDINAFCLPGGYIYVYDGLVKFAQSDDELAGVLAHEICHASQRHLAYMQKEQSKMGAMQIPLILASILTGSNAGLMAGSLVGTALTNGWSVKAEESADNGGVQLLIATGYNPTAMITFMERLQMEQGAMEKVVDLGIFRTHPPSRRRADSIEAFMRSNSIPIRRSAVTATFRVTASEFSPGTYLLKFGNRKLFAVGGDNPKAKAAELTKRLNEFFDTVPEMYEITIGDQGEVFGRNKLLVRFDEDDATVNASTVQKMQEDASKALRSCAFSLAYHIWEGRG
jgi:beta-barrel assembly-enhancing protease